MPSKKPKNQQYSAKDIISMTPLEHIRRRPGMYVGGINKRAFHNLLWEIVDNSIDEAMAGHCTEITIISHSDTKISVIDNGRGIPVETNEYGKNYLEISLTQVGSYGKFDKKNYTVIGGLLGVGLPAVNALSSGLIAEVKRDGFLWRQTYQEGIPITKVEQVRLLAEDESTGTSITFSPDFTIMDEGLTFDYDLIVEHCQQLAYLLPEVTFSIEKKNNLTDNIVIRKANGLVDWVADLNTDAETLHPILYKEFSKEFEDRNYKWTVKVELAFQFRKNNDGLIKSFINTIKTDDGVHINAMKKTLIPAIYGDDASNHQNSLYGLVAVVHIFHPDPQFESATKKILLNPEVKDVVEDCVKQLLAENLDIHAQLQGYFRI